MDKTIISWTVSNWITVFFMAFLGFAIFSGLSASLVKIMNKSKVSQDA